MRRVLAGIAVWLALALPALAQPVGTFAVTGQFDGTTYRGTAEIRVNGALYDITWRIEGQAAPVRGVGMWENGLFIAGYRAGDDTGVIVYHRREDGQWEGRWAPIGARAPGTERLVPSTAAK